MAYNLLRALARAFMRLSASAVHGYGALFFPLPPPDGADWYQPPEPSAGPPSGHPEQVSTQPLTPTERALWAQLGYRE